jgi:hypothetical protein
MGWKSAIGALFMGIILHAAEPERLKTIDKGAFSGIQEPLRVVVTNKTQRAELWTKHIARKQPKAPPPDVDFEKESVIFVALGRKNTGGYSIEITDVRHSGKKTEVVVATRQPKEGGFNIQALTAPFHIVEVPKIEGSVKFTTAENKNGG